MNPFKVFQQPEYFYRPGQVLLKLKRTLHGRYEAVEPVRMPWGAVIHICPGEHIGARIWHRGVFDLTVLEAIARLVDPGEVALDIGANIGQMSSLISRRLGPKGKLLSFEPHPKIFELLSRSAAG